VPGGGGCSAKGSTPLKLDITLVRTLSLNTLDFGPKSTAESLPAVLPFHRSRVLSSSRLEPIIAAI
jgi:hypothetical protein